MRTQYRYRWHIKDFNPSKKFQEQTPTAITAGLTQCSEYKINGHHPAAKSLPFCGKIFCRVGESKRCLSLYMLYVDSVYFSLGVLAQQTCKHTVSNVVVQRTWRACMTWRHTCIRKIRRELLNAQLRHWKLWWKKINWCAECLKSLQDHPKSSERFLSILSMVHAIPWRCRCNTSMTVREASLGFCKHLLTRKNSVSSAGTSYLDVRQWWKALHPESPWIS